jgi:CDP-glucose 4,6-dehydratase
MGMKERRFSGRRVLVTGATGIVGSALVRELTDSGADVVAVVRDEPAGSPLLASGALSQINVVRGSVENLRLVQRTMAEYEIEIAFHLAAQTQVPTADRDPFGTLEANIRGTYVLLEAIRVVAPSTPIVIASSDKAYGDSGSLPYLEAHPLMGRGIYDASKSAADLVSSAYAATFDMPLAIARCGNIYGPGDLNWQRLVPSVIRALLTGERPVIRSDGNPRRDYLHVRDAVEGYLLLAESLLEGRFNGEAFNFGHGEPVSVLTIVQRLQTIIGRPDLHPQILGEAAGEIRDQYLDASKARDKLGWEPKVSLDDGLASTVAWYRSFLL